MSIFAGDEFGLRPPSHKAQIAAFVDDYDNRRHHESNPVKAGSEGSAQSACTGGLPCTSSGAWITT